MTTKAKKQILIGIGAILVVATAVVGYLLFSQSHSNSTAVGTNRVITDDAYGISFSFPEGPEAFILIEPPANQAGIQKAYVMMPTTAFNEYKESETLAEAPAGINLFILSLDEPGNSENATTTDRPDRMTRLKDWAVRFDGLTQYSKKTAEPVEVEVDGLKGLRYETGGEPYKQTIFLATYKNNVYMFLSQYTDDTDMTKTNFEPLLQSVSFD